MSRPYPHSEEAEAAVLGSLLHSPEHREQVFSQLSPGDFWKPQNRLCYKAMLQLSERQGLDPLLLLQHLKDSGGLDAVGGAPYIASLGASVPVPGHALHYAGIVLDNSVKRGLLRLADGARETIDSGQGVEALDRVSAEVEELQSRRTETDQDAPLHTATILQTLWTELDAQRQTGGSPLVRSGVDCCDRLGLFRGEVLEICARPGHGKTAVGMQAAVGAARNGSAVLVYSGELPAHTLLVRELSRDTGVPVRRILEGTTTAREVDQLKAAAQELAGLPLWVYDTPSRTPKQVERQAKALNRKLQAKGEEPLRLMLWDYLDLLYPDGGSRGLNDEGVLRRTAYGIRETTKRLGLASILLIQANRSLDEVPMGDTPRMRVVKGSSGIEAIATGLLVLRIDHTGQQMRASVLKSRHGGETDTTWVYDWQGSRYSVRGDPR